MAGTLQPLDQKFALVGPDGRPTDYFIRWAQQKQIDIEGSISLADLQEYLTAHKLQEGLGIALTPDGDLNNAPSISVRNGLGLNFDAMHNLQVRNGVGLDFDGASKLKLADTAVAPGTYGDATHVAQITVDQQGRITGVTLVAISGGGGGGGGGFSPPLAANFPTLNAGALIPVLTDSALFGLSMKVTGTGGGVHTAMALKPPPGASFFIQARMRNFFSKNLGSAGLAGICLRNSTTGQIISLHTLTTNTGINTNWEFAKWNGNTSFNGLVSNGNYGVDTPVFRLQSDGMTITAKMGNGVDFMTLGSIAISSFLGAINQIGLFFDIEYAADAVATCDYYLDG